MREDGGVENTVEKRQDYDTALRAKLQDRPARELLAIVDCVVGILTDRLTQKEAAPAQGARPLGETVDFPGVIALSATQKALRCCPSAHPGRLFWVARSHIAETSEIQRVGDQGTLTVSTWWAGQSKVGLNFE